MTYSFTNEVVRASAGSGKTFKLSERYLKLILLGEKVDSILATTFTRKAAGEIQDRILLRLGRGANSLEGARELYDQLIKDEPEFERVVADLYGLDRITPEKAQALFQDKLEEVTRSLQKIRVSTLDSFFMQIAGGYAFEIGLPPNWKIVEEIENERILYAALLHTYSQAKNYPVQNEKTARTDEVNAAVTLARLLFKGDLKRSI
ncbi:MAG: UvrD-helicase domain-containing protein, partial [Thermoguttaceae bacterium]|nr:UvrD-helicase domain-containing protein [Thermoguttaceae bacterium]